MYITDKDHLISSLQKAVPMPPANRVLMVDPAFFSVDYVINPHMEGNIGTVDHNVARAQWQSVHDIFTQLRLNVSVLEGQKGLPDMVFCANQSLPFIDDEGNKSVVMSHMYSEHRTNEVPFIEQWFRRQGVQIHFLKTASAFEGMGDALWHYKKRFLWGGYGFRTSPEVYQEIQDLFNTPVALLKLTHPSFYHLDTCFCILNEQSVLIYPDAFDADGLEWIHAGFKRVIYAPEHEAKKLFACNACCPDG
ncbi:arginine deiminase-related protein, partial [Balneolaceae bacterium ANBcel3]|nr:arginine deiminase-related protein [Balneolaceae bacterium ANBcel3]